MTAHTPTLASAPRYRAHDVPTPALLVDLTVAQRNIDRMQAYADEHGLGLRPHTKTHKSLRLAARQLAAGARGLTVAKVGEAEVMAAADGCGDLLVAYPAFDPGRRARLARLARGRGDVAVRVGVDSAVAADAIADAARDAGATIGLLVDLDVGMHRTGVQSPADALALAQRIDKTKGARLDGIMFYPGHVRGGPDDQAAALSEVAVILGETLALWRKSGLAAAIVSGGSTPAAPRSHLVGGATEIRPGTYVFNDMNTVRAGHAGLDDCAARVACTVISDAVPGKVVLDAGSKTLTSDRCSPALDSGFGHVVEYPGAKIVRLSEEHGEVDLSGCSGAPPRLGERIHVIPNHICPCVNLQNLSWAGAGLFDGRGAAAGALEPLAIEGRGLTS